MVRGQEKRIISKCISLDSYQFAVLDFLRDDWLHFSERVEHAVTSLNLSDRFEASGCPDELVLLETTEAVIGPAGRRHIEGGRLLLVKWTEALEARSRALQLNVAANHVLNGEPAFDLFDCVHERS
jgi:hypothetical protein